jgi:DNA polymerase I-like protein with 3'-5' exonuclease and polymerase domains
LVITIDFETYYDREFSLSKITTEEYVRDRRFEVIGVGVKVDEGETEWFSGTEAQTKFWLGKFKWSESLVLAHNMMFDGAIMAWRFDINPKGWLDTLCMGRAVDGVEVSGSLKNLAERYEVGEKGTEVVNALGKRRKDFSEEELARYGEYCRNDVELTYKLFNILRAEFPTKELKVIDLTLRMFTHPVLKLDLPLLEQHLLDVVERKEKLLEATSASKDDLMSNDKFAQLLIELGVDPPRKISLTTGREAWAFAKTDEDFKALSDHPDDRVQALVAARLGNKTTLEETRTQRFIDIAKRGLMPIYGKPQEEITKDERFVGKTTILGAGYGMGAIKFQAQLKTFNAELSEDECKRIIKVYRETYPSIPNLWRSAQACLESILQNQANTLGRENVLEFSSKVGGFKLPSGLWQRYEGLEKITDSDGTFQYQYKTRKGMTKIYGGKVIENVCQAIARCVIAEQMLRISKKYRVVLTVHDAIACVASKAEAEEAVKYVEECMRWKPEWCLGLPLNCEVGYGANYGET